MLAACASGDDARLLAELAPRILDEHARMYVSWHALEQQLQAIASGASAELLATKAARAARARPSPTRPAGVVVTA